MPNFIDITGKKYNRLKVLSLSHKNGKTFWNCLCDCGNTRIIAYGDLKYGNTKSCGCLRNEKVSNLNKTHGKRHTSIYSTWSTMKQRCNNPKNEKYSIYGGRGIKVCKRWEEFENFYQDMGNRPKNKSIDRINNNGNYEPGNCKWSTPKEQANNRRNNLKVGV